MEQEEYGAPCAKEPERQVTNEIVNVVMSVVTAAVRDLLVQLSVEGAEVLELRTETVNAPVSHCFVSIRGPKGNVRIS